MQGIIQVCKGIKPLQLFLDMPEPFDEALEAATEKLGEYYNKTAASDAHIISMGIVITLPSISLGQ